MEASLLPEELTAEEHVVWLDAFMEPLAVPSEAEQSHFVRRRQLRLDVGLSDAGELVWADGATGEA